MRVVVLVVVLLVLVTGVKQSQLLGLRLSLEFDNMFLFDIEHFLSDVRGLRYLHLKKVYFFVGHPVKL